MRVEAIIRLRHMTPDEITPQTLRQGIKKITDGDTILGNLSPLLLLPPQCVLRWIRGDLTIEDQFLEERQTFLITSDLILDQEVLAMTFAMIPTPQEMRLLDLRPIQGHQGTLDLILDS
jgi:hypothetical protein